MPDLKPFIVLGLALGGVFALSGVGLVVLFRATGVVNLAYGAVGAFGALITWQLINEAGWNEWLAFWIWGDDARSIVLPTTSEGFNIGEVRVNYTQILALALALVVTGGTAVF